MRILTHSAFPDRHESLVTAVNAHKLHSSSHDLLFSQEIVNHG